MNYWTSVLEEVLNKADHHYTFKFTDLGRVMLSKRTRTFNRKSGKAQQSPMYFLGDMFEDVYFTQREMETLFHLLQGKTIPETGKALNLSARTIEFYLKNMKLKTGTRNKVELLLKIRETKVMEAFEPIKCLIPVIECKV